METLARNMEPTWNQPHKVGLEVKLGESSVMIPIGEGALSARALPYIELDQIIQDSLFVLDSLGIFSRDINKNLVIASTPDEILDVMKLRSRVYNEFGYDAFQDKIPGFNFDNYDKNSVNLMFNRKGEVTGSTRIVCDSKNGVPTENYYPSRKGIFDSLREEYKDHFLPIAELSRTVIDSRFRKTGSEFKEMFAGLYRLGNELDVGTYVLSMAKRMYEALYSKCGMEVLGYESEVEGMKVDCVLLSWNPREVNDFFKKRFLRYRYH